MYRILVGAETRVVPTRAAVAAFLSDRKRIGADLLSTVTASGINGPLRLMSKNSKLGVALFGDACQELSSLAREVRDNVSLHDGTLREPWQMTELQWESVMVLSRIADGQVPGLTQDALASRLPSRPGSLFESRSLVEWFADEMRAVFGFGYPGPRLSGSDETCNVWRSHVLHALCTRKDVPKAVVEEFAQTFAGDGTAWELALLNQPSLQGELGVERTQMLVQIANGPGGCGITAENLSGLIQAVRLGPSRPDHVQMDDLLFNLGFLKSLPIAQAVPADLSDVKPLARLIRSECIAVRRCAMERHYAERRSRGDISLRGLHQAHAHLEVEAIEVTAAFASMVEQAIEERDTAHLLQLVDNPDDWQVGTKRALEKHFGVKLLGLKSLPRRKAVFALCGYEGEAMQAEELRLKELERRRKASLERKRLAGQLDRLVVSFEGESQTLTRVIETLVNRGFVISKANAGSAARYYLVEGEDSLQGFLVKSSVGTLDYARLLIEARDSEVAGSPAPAVGAQQAVEAAFA